ncbi:MAG: hypothetical protein II621_07315 [Clostridia bacterium]|nr:hypothetical protein [Clostridia bacterium]
MKTLYRDCKQGIYAGTSVSFMVILFGALGAGLFFFLQNIFGLDHVLGATEAANEPRLWFILFWATDFFFVIMALVTAYKIAGPSAIAPVLALSVYFAHFTYDPVSAEGTYLYYFGSPLGYAHATEIGYMGYLILAVALALLIRLMSAGWDGMKDALGRGLDKLFSNLRKKFKKLPDNLSGAEIANGLDLFVCMLVIPPIAAALTFLLVRYGIALPFGALASSLGRSLAALAESHVLLFAVCVGLMVGFDIIGPVSLAAYGVCTAAYLDSGSAQAVTIYGAVFVAVGWTAFFGVLWCKLFKRGGTPDIEDFNMATSGPINAFFENIKLTTIFAMPIAARSPFAFIPGYMAGAGVTGFLTALFRIVNGAYLDGSLPKYTSGFHAYGGVDQTYRMLFERGELYMGFSLPLRSGDWLTCRIPLFFIILFGGAVGGFVILFLRDLQCRLLKKRGIRYDFSTDITITLRKKVREYREKLAK